MTQSWAYDGPPPSIGTAGSPVTLVEGSSFCISGRSGDILGGCEQGLFVRDTRVLSSWLLSIDRQKLEPLTVTIREPFSATFIARVPPRPGEADSALLVCRQRFVGSGMREDIIVRNLVAEPTHCHLALDLAADFADLFEVKEGRVPAPDHTTESRGKSALVLRCRRGDADHAVVVRAADATVSGTTLSWQLDLPGRHHWSTCLEVAPMVNGATQPLGHPCGHAVELARPAIKLREWRHRAPALTTNDPSLAAVIQRSVEDLGGLRIFDAEHPDRAVVAAGAPWFMTLFGRDSLLTSWMVLPLDRSLALGTLQTLAAHQGSRVDPASEEEPGRILHEMRYGPASTAALAGGNAYYGTTDATPLFVMLLGELRRWGLEGDEVELLLPHADRALDWIERYGDRDGDGFVEYARATEQGLFNQGWKDSHDGVTFADGRIAQPPIALAEVQAYVYAAYIARAHFARAAGDQTATQHWTDKASRLKSAFNDAFWLPNQGWYALGLDRDKHPIDSLASNMGHCLWTGIVDLDKAASVADRLMSPEMFSGWGVRTLATSMTAYNPMSYHNGSIWPHDNALCAAGLMRYGFIELAQRIATGLLDAATHFGHRLPELFCGFPRDEFPEPVPYPTSCSPQAWAAAAPVQLLRTLLRLDPWAPFDKIWCDPAVPDRFLPLRLDRLRFADNDLTIDVGRDSWTITGLTADIELIRQPRQPLVAPQ